MKNPTMHAAVVDQPQGAFRVVEQPRPQPRPGEVLVKIAASAVNPLDGKIRAGQAEHARQPLPAVLGIDGAGTVVELGPGTSGFRVGDEVMGMMGGVGGLPGTLAEYVAVDAHLLAFKPRRLSSEEAATLPLAFITAWEGLVDRARVRSGQTVLVQAGAGGVGHVAVQVALARGATVFATGRESHRAVIEATGAAFVSWDEASIQQSQGRFDVVYDTLGGRFLDQSFDLVKEFGHVVSCLGWGTHALAPLSFKAATYSGVFTLAPLLTGQNRRSLGLALGQASSWAESGRLTPRVTPQRFDLTSVNQAHELLASRTASGRIVVTVA